MKRLLTMAAMFLCCMTTTFAQFSGSGSGTENDPYLIMNPIQLYQLRNFLNTSRVYFKMMADVDLTDFLEDENPTQGWSPVGTSSQPFKGVLDGNGKTISGLWINRNNTDYVGLFGYCDGATIQNLILKDVDIKGNTNVGAICGRGYNRGSISNCVLSGRVICKNYAGGCVGRCDGFIVRGITSSVEVRGGDYSGGIAGRVGDYSISISDCFVYTTITGSNKTGGIVGGEDFRCEMTNCGFVGCIKGTSDVGGICGYTYSFAETDNRSSEKNCYAVAFVSGTGENTGGLIGFCNSVVESCYFSGRVTGQKYTGGLIGYKNHNSVKKCYFHGSITGSSYVGGLCGYINMYTGIISNVIIASSIKATDGYVGRLYGYNYYSTGSNIGALGTSDENKSYNRTIVISQGVAQDISDGVQHGTGVSTTTLKLKANYVAMGWDFNSIWAIQETECYPYMQRQTAPPIITSKVVSGATIISGKCVDGGTVTLEIDGEKQKMVSEGHKFAFTVSPLQAGHEVRISAKAEGKEPSYYTTETVQYLGSGKENDPYQVYTASDLTGVYRKGYFKLMNDIDLTNYINQFSPTEGWESIGREGSETIHFDGNGHKITGLWCNSTRDNTGLFSCFANGTIKNLTVETVKNKQVKGGVNTGILIGKMINGTIEKCIVSGSVSDGTPVGGMVGLFDGGKISLCQANVTINTTGEKSFVGGLVGETANGEIDQCFTQGKIFATGKESYVAGLVGKNSATITNCYSNAIITSPYCAAGVVAYNYGVVDKCYATGNLFSSNYAAGIIGYNDGSNAIVKNCVSMNNKIDVTYESQQQQQGGGYGQRIIGGIKNGAPAPELNNYALKTMQVSVNNVAQKVYDDIMNGVGKSGSELLKANIYKELGWDFTNTWSIKENENYPSLANNEGIVVKPGEDPNPDQEPELTDDDRIIVEAITATKGQQVAFSIDLENKTTDLTAYQFDLTLPDGISLSSNDKGKFIVTKTGRYEDDSQMLNISKTEGNTYRFVSFSMSNDVITGMSGAILNASLTIGASINDGSYEATIANIVVTKTDGTQLKLKEAKFNIVVTNVIKGDANGDGEVNVSDIVEIVNYIMGKPSANFVLAAADLNGDGEINVTDIVKVVSIIMSTNNNSASVRAAVTEMADNDRLILSVDDDNAFSLCLDNEEQYVASQFDLRLKDGQKLESISLNDNRSDGHMITYAKTGENSYRVLAFSPDNRPFNGNSGELFTFKVSDNGSIEVRNILFVTSGEKEKMFPSLYEEGTTGIDIVNASDAMDVYSIDGRMIKNQVSTKNGLKKGLYIINGKKVVIQ